MSTKLDSLYNKLKDIFKIDKFFFFRIKLLQLSNKNKLNDLYKNDVLTKDEFEKAKKKILNQI